jgi:hypothetical protein
MSSEDKANAASGEGSQEASLYPYTSLVPTLKIADAVKELGGARSAVSKSSLAAHFKESEKSASFLQRVSSAKAFGLIVGRSDYSLSEVARRYYSPTSEHDRSNALLDFLAAPTSFREIIRLFDGDQLPNRMILANIFSEKLKVPESWKERAAAFFENSAQFIGVLDEKRILRVNALKQKAAVISIVENHATAEEIISRMVPKKQQTPEIFSDQEQHSLFLDKEKKRRFDIAGPLFITRAEYQRICKWIEVTLIVEEPERDKLFPQDLRP